MSNEPGNVTLAPIKILGLPDNYCFTNLADFLKALQTFAFAEISGEITNVHVSVSQPLSTERSDVWFRVDSSNKFIGIYMFSGSTWEQVLPAPKQVFWMYGDSTDLPAGFILVDGSNPNFTAPELAHIESFYYPAAPQPVYSYFAVTWAGF